MLLLCALMILWPLALENKTGTPGPNNDLVRTNETMPPRVERQKEPTYSETALALGIQGSCLLDMTVDEQGLPTDISIVRPLGYGLDEKAIEAVSKWRFKPAMKYGRPVKTPATVEIKFQLTHRKSDPQAEEERKRFDALMSRLNQQNGGAATPEQVSRMEEEVNARYPPAEYEMALWKFSGKNVPKDSDGALLLLNDAVAKNYAPAMFYLGRMQISGTLLPKDPLGGLDMMTRAANRGNLEAEELLAQKFQAGDGVKRDLYQSSKYFRLCAAYGVPDCQLALAKLLLGSSDTSARTHLQALAWLHLAVTHGSGEAQIMSIAAHVSDDLNLKVLSLAQKLEQHPAQNR